VRPKKWRVKHMKVNEIRDFTDVELESTLADLKKELFNLRFQNATNQLENPMRISEVKKSIARIKTVMVERKLEKAAN
jgi:large subunit ribosomal protein L29